MMLLSEKMRSRIHFHYNLESLHQHVSKNILPESLGGDLSENDAIDITLVDELLKEDATYESRMYSI